MMAVKIFSSTKMRDREEMGERITQWIRANNVVVIDKIVTQSSDSEYHCLSCTIFYEGDPGTR